MEDNTTKKVSSLKLLSFENCTINSLSELGSQDVLAGMLAGVLHERTLQTTSFTLRYTIEILLLWLRDLLKDNTVAWNPILANGDIQKVRNVLYNEYIRDCHGQEECMAFTFENWWIIFRCLFPFIHEKDTRDGVIYSFPERVVFRRYYREYLEPQFKIDELANKARIEDGIDFYATESEFEDDSEDDD